MATIACLGVIIALMCRPTLSFGVNRTSCPDTSQWRMRASSFCNRSEPAYFCLYDDNTNVFKEFCRKAPDVQRPGYEFVIRGNLDGRKCRNDRYQPFKLTTDGQSKCMFKKSKCTDEGQIMYNDGTTISDSLCRCDSTQSYGFVKTTGDRCFCDPSVEDCTCYKINCQDGYVLSSDYMCTEWEHFSGTNNCTDIKSSRSEIHRVIPSRDDIHLMTNQESCLSVFKNSKFTGHIILCLMTAAALDEIENLKKRIKELEEKQLKYKEEKELQEKEFGSKRAKFKEIFLQKEEEYKTERDAHLETQKKADTLAKELNDVRTELEDIKAAVSFSESNKEDTIEDIRRQCREEVDTLQGLLKEVAEEASTSTAAQYENERTKLQELNEKYEDEVRELRSKLSQEREGFLTSVAKQLKQIAPGSLGQQSSNQSMEDENLEASMRKAQADAEILKSVVLPLEDEIKGLKSKLATYEKNPDDIATPPMKHATPETQSLSDLDAKDPEDRIQELLHYLRVEKSSRKDLEMYVAVLTTQKNIFEEECDKTKKDLEEVCRILNEEKREHEQLQQTWQMANDQFLESQTLMMMDLRRMESVLSAEQQRQIAEALKKAEEASEKFKNADAKMQEKIKQQSQKDLVRANSPNITDDLNNETDDEKSILDASDLPEGDSFLDSRVLNSNEELDGLRVQISPEKVLNLPYLSQAQTKALTDPTPELQLRQSLIASAKSKVDRISVDGKRLVGQKEWDLLQQQLKESRDKLGKPCDMCNNYEDQLQNIQDDLKKEQVRAKSFERNLNSEIHTTESQQKYIAELEDTLKKTVSEADEQVSSLLNKLQDCEKYIEEMKQQFTQSQVDLRDQLQVLTGSREEVQNELTRLQKENDTLIGKHSKYAQQLQNEDINLPNNIEEMQLLLLKYREEIIQSKVAKEHTEETLKSEIMFLKDQIHAEQQEKNNIEESLSQELATVQEKLVVQESLKSELERESSVRADLSKKLTESEASLKSIQAKSKQLINALRQQVAEHSEIRSKLESDVQKYRSKIQSLQIDLDNSEAVQRDFVKLSQSLQIQLEKIRQAETEVRWQQEEDIDDCNNCKQQFSVTKRKHHCRHCGRIFCSDCVTKTVNSGPNSRPSKVCDICHTILVRDALPYFSTEPPSTPS